MAARYQFMLIGQIGAGKTSLFNQIEGWGGAAVKTQALNFGCSGIDTPGEYMSHPRLYHALITTAADVNHLIYIHAANRFESRLPPGFFFIYGNKRVDTVITKVDAQDADVPRVREILNQAQFKGRIFETSIFDDSSIQRLKSYLQECKNN